MARTALVFVSRAEGKQVSNELRALFCHKHLTFYISHTLGIGVYISRIEEGSVAERAGLRPGDTILEVNGTPFSGTLTHDEALTVNDVFVSFLLWLIPKIINNQPCMWNVSERKKEMEADVVVVVVRKESLICSGYKEIHSS